MSRIWKQPVKIKNGEANLIQPYTIIVRVASFTFRFKTVEQLQDCLAYYQQKVHPSSRIPTKKMAADLGANWRTLRGWDIERWFEKLPMYLLEKPKREKVVKALTRALKLAKSGKV